MRTILHVDFDSFFASCEQHFNPNLRGKPIGVTAENGRNAVIAASREAKWAGVKSPNTTWEAKRICPEIIFVKADFERYLEITKKLLEISSSYSPIVEMFSLDEVFIDLTPVLNLYKNRVIARNEMTKQSSLDRFAGARDDNLKAVLFVVSDFKKRLRDEVGDAITVSIGLSYNKLLAKLATSINKPDGFGQITKESREKIMYQISLTDIMGIGRSFERRLNLLGITTFKQLADYPLYLLKAEFGNVASQNLKALSMGIDDSPVVSYREEIETKSVGRNYCLPKNTYDREEILKTIYELCEEIAIKLRRLKMKCRTVGLFLHGDHAEGARKTVPRYICSGKEIFELCEQFFNKWNLEYVRQVSVYSSNLIEARYDTIPMFDPPKKEVIERLVDQINDRFGHHTIRRGALVNTNQLHTKPNGFGADRAMRKEIAAGR